MCETTSTPPLASTCPRMQVPTTAPALPHRCVIHLAPSFSFHNRTAASLHLGVLRRAPETALPTPPAERRRPAPSTAPGTASLLSLERAAERAAREMIEQRAEGFSWPFSFPR